MTSSLLEILPAIPDRRRAARKRFKLATVMLCWMRQADPIVLGHLIVEAKSNESPAAPELIEAPGLTGALACLRGARWETLLKTVLRLDRTVYERDATFPQTPRAFAKSGRRGAIAFFRLQNPQSRRMQERTRRVLAHGSRP